LKSSGLLDWKEGEEGSKTWPKKTKAGRITFTRNEMSREEKKKHPVCSYIKKRGSKVNQGFTERRGTGCTTLIPKAVCRWWVKRTKLKPGPKCQKRGGEIETPERTGKIDKSNFSGTHRGGGGGGVKQRSMSNQGGRNPI